MAKVTFAKNQPIQSLSGSVGAITFRTVNGQTKYYLERVMPRFKDVTAIARYRGEDLHE